MLASLVQTELTAVDLFEQASELDAEAKAWRFVNGWGSPVEAKLIEAAEALRRAARELARAR